jgi:hypothetical protein
MEINEMVRRFIMRSFELGGHVIIISPAQHLLFRRATYLPYTWGETPWQTLYDLAHLFAERVDIVTTWPPKDEKELQLLYNLAEYAKPPRSVPLYLYIMAENIPVLLINEKEAVYEAQVIQDPKELGRLREVAKDIIGRSKEVGIFEYDDIRQYYCRRFRYYDARCLF